MKAMLYQELVREIFNRKVRKLNILSSTFFSREIDNHTTIENEKIIKKMSFIIISCDMIHVKKKIYDRRYRAVRNNDKNEKENTKSRAREDFEQYKHDRFDI